MTEALLSRDIALRIRLAADALPDTPVGRLIQVLAELTGLPFVPERLAAIKVKDLRQAAGGALADLPAEALRQALALLQGDDQLDPMPLPALEHLSPGELPGSLRVACASDQGEQLDGHFGACRRFLIYQVAPGDCRLIDIRTPGGDVSTDDRNAARAELIRDCRVLFVASIGGPAAAKLVRLGVHPVKCAPGTSARAQIQALSDTIATAPPPWLAKCMGYGPEARVRFAREGEPA
jgi:nitrogen fixation protein NifX